MSKIEVLGTFESIAQTKDGTAPRALLAYIAPLQVVYVGLYRSVDVFQLGGGGASSSK